MSQLPNNLGTALASGAVWMLSVKFTTRFLGVISMLIFARLLTPDDFGLMAIAMSFFALTALLTKFGFDTVLIQNQQADDAHYDTAWTLNLALGLLCGIALFAAAPLIAVTYDDQRLTRVLYVISLLFLLTGVKNVGTVNFRKNLDFDREFMFETIPRFIGFFVAVPLAFWLRNYWVLIIGTFAIRFSSALLSYTMHPYRPRISLRAWRDLFHFSKWLMIGNALSFLNMRSPEMIVGKLLPIQMVGFISIAKELPNAAILEVVSTINRATYPGYSMISDDLAKLREIYLKVLATVSIYVLPASFGMAYIADPLVPVLLGEQWLASIQLIQILALAELLSALNTNTAYVFLAMGVPKLPTLLLAARVAVLIPGLIILVPSGGLVGVGIAVFFSSASTFVLTMLIMRERLGLQVEELLVIHTRPCISSIMMIFAMHMIDVRFPGLDSTSPIVFLLAMTVGGAVVYGVCIALLWWLNGMPNGPESKLFRVVREKFRQFYST